MSEQQTGDKTEKATPQKLRKARMEGQVARSRDIGTCVGILIALKLIVVLTPAWLVELKHIFALSFADLSGDDRIGNAASMLFPAAVLLLCKMLAPLAAVPAGIIIASLVPGGWTLSHKNVMPKLNRLNPLSGLKRLVSGKHYVQFGTTVLKALVLMATLFIVCRSNLSGFVRLQGAPLADALTGGANLFLTSALTLTCIIIVFALVDIPVQQIIFKRGQRMSKRDIKDEMKQSEGKPEIKSRIRQIQRQLARQGIRKTVPTADVVVMNPTHYAIALKYDVTRAQAPYVVAKGVDEVALFIRDVARGHNVEVIELPPLARAIYHTSQVNQQIPAELYRAVAQVLSYVLQIKAFRNGGRDVSPSLPTGITIPEHLQKSQSR